MKRLLITCLLLLVFQWIGAQTSPKAQPKPAAKKGGVVLPIQVIGKDTFVVYTVDQVPPPPVEMDPATRMKVIRWIRFKRDVDTAMRYAQICKYIVARLDQNMSEIDSKKGRKNYFKAQEDSLRSIFTERLHNLTYDQGALLIKLISRETGHTAYQLIREYKNGWTAFWANKFTQVYFSDVKLKEQYDRNSADNKPLEDALRELGYQ